MNGPFASRLTRQPLPFDREAAADCAATFADMTPDLRGLLSVTASCSQYLRSLMLTEADWLREALLQPPETVCAQVLAGLEAAQVDALPDALRAAKRRFALITALADLGGVWSLMQVTGALTDLADRANDARRCGNAIPLSSALRRPIGVRNRRPRPACA